MQFIDDIDGTPADETVTFSLDGTAFQVDLSADNAAKLREFLSPYMDAAGKVPQKKGKRSTDSVAIRIWAGEHGHTVSDRGRIPASVRALYEAHLAAIREAGE